MTPDERALLLVVAKAISSSLDTPRKIRLDIQELVKKLEAHSQE